MTNSKIHKIYIEMRRGMGQSGRRLLNVIEKEYGELGRNGKQSFCGGHNAPTLFQNR
jgi:hypothetical protein